MKKKLYIIPVVELEDSSMFTALCSSTNPVGTGNETPGENTSEPGGMGAPGRRVF